LLHLILLAVGRVLALQLLQTAIVALTNAKSIAITFIKCLHLGSQCVGCVGFSRISKASADLFAWFDIDLFD